MRERSAVGRFQIDPPGRSAHCSPQAYVRSSKIKPCDQDREKFVQIIPSYAGKLRRSAWSKGDRSAETGSPLPAVS